MKLKTITSNTKGFTAIEGLLALVLVVAIATVGWYVYDRNKSDETQKTATPTTAAITTFEQCKAAGNPIAESSPEQCSANGQTFVNEAAQPKPEVTKEQDFLAIKELGVKLPRTTALAGAYYHIGNQGRSAFFSLESLKGTDCAADKTSQIVLGKATEAQLAAENGGATLKKNAQKIGNHYYYLVGSNSGCSTDAAIQAKATKLRADVTAAFKQGLHPIE